MDGGFSQRFYQSFKKVSVIIYTKIYGEMQDLYEKNLSFMPIACVWHQHMVLT